MTLYSYLQFAANNSDESNQLNTAVAKYQSLGYDTNTAQELAFLERVVLYSLYNPPSKK